jgi:hypothetical protein
MADTRLILHVKGTEAETQEVPKEVVKTAVAEGKMSQSQLIWSVPDNTWKQVRELPELLPVENLILHVKGTESETREMPKQAVKNAISRGEITHSQLIWSATDSTWKQVREIPDLLPGETMILHVKGTESDTRELPKPAIRAAIQRGELSQSQLIWSPLDSAWKPAREMPELMPGESLTLHVKGTTADTTEMPRTAIRTAIKEGKITHSQLIWSNTENQWKQVRELPDLLPSQKLAPPPQRRPQAGVADTIEPDSPRSPVARVASGATPVAVPKVRPAVAAPPRVTIASAATAAPQPKIAKPAVAEAQVPTVRVMPATPPAAVPRAVPVPEMQIPSVRVAPASGETAQPRPVAAKAPRAVPAVMPAAMAGAAAEPHEGHVVKEEPDNFHPVKWICVILGVLLLLVVAVNIFLIDRPLASNIGKTDYANVFVYGHYGAFVQPNVIVIHIPHSAQLTPEKLPDFLVALARSTPKNPITNDDFDRVALTSGWTAEYSFPGSAWKSLGDMKGQSLDDIRTQILSNGADAGGNELMPPSTMNDAAREAKRDATWKDFVANFTGSGS